jgi:predicted naringenin-chalcone synthase
MIVCTELCTLHFQKEATPDNIASTLLFADGSAAALVTHNSFQRSGLLLNGFYSEVVPKGKRDMAWELSSTGFLMTLSGYIPELIEEDFEPLVQRALQQTGIGKEAIRQWCIHPGGRRIVDAIQKSLQLTAEDLQASYQVLREYGNMSSPTILFVLKELMQQQAAGSVFAAAFGPGLTMETFTATYE